MKFSKLKRKYSRKLRKRYIQFAAVFGVQIEQTYSIGNIPIVLTGAHALPRFQHEHALYDRFLPVLASKFGKNETIVDVGANCGDSLAAMVARNQNSDYFCIEPDRRFFALLGRNRASMLSQFPDLHIGLSDALAASKLTAMKLVGNDSTKTAVIGDGPNTSKSLDTLLAENKVTKVRLIKIDVDGNDWDVINSAGVCIRKVKPVLFFECDFRTVESKFGYKATLEKLKTFGYSDWVIFDNFGALLVRTADISVVVQIMDYMELQRLKRTTRTFYYIDVLAATSRDIILVNDVVDQYAIESLKNQKLMIS
jgi:FkbM family methyltransferase